MLFDACLTGQSNVVLPVSQPVRKLFISKRVTSHLKKQIWQMYIQKRFDIVTKVNLFRNPTVLY